jgi:hypothetical protein
MTAPYNSLTESSNPSEEALRRALSTSGNIAGILSGQLARLRKDLDNLNRTATDLGETLDKIKQAESGSVGGAVGRGSPDSGAWINLEDPEIDAKLRHLLRAHYEQLGFVSRRDVHDEVRRLLDEAARKQAAIGEKNETVTIGEATSEPAGVRSLSVEEFRTKIRQLAELGVHEPSLESASKELKRIIKASDARRDAVYARFGKYLVEELLPSGERAEYYARFNIWFRNFSDGGAQLIVPGKGESLDTRRCVSVGRHTTSVGPLEAIVRIERPGVMVGDKVVTRARVLTT